MTRTKGEGDVQLLDAALAFALAMMGFATVVTVVMEMVHRVFKVRRKGLERVLERLGREVILPALDPVLRDGVSPDSRVRRLIVKILNNPVYATGSSLDEGLFKSYDTISVEHLLRRLMETEEFKTLGRAGEARLKDTLNQVAMKFEEFGAGANDFFRRRARGFSLYVGMGLALIVNIDGIRMFEAFMRDPSLGAQVIERSASLEQSMGEAVTALEQVRAEAGDPTGEGAAEIEAIEARAREAQAMLADLEALGLPVGADYFPHCRVVGSPRVTAPDPLCRPGAPDAGAARWMGWFISIIFTGLLIGLGGPFWFDVARRIGQVRGAVRGGVRTEGSNATEAPETRSELVDAVVAAANRVVGEAPARLRRRFIE